MPMTMFDFQSRKPLNALVAMGRLLCLLLAGFLVGCAADEPLIPPAELGPFDRTVPVRASWSYEVGKPDKRGASRFQPVSFDGTIHTASVDGVILAIDAASGKSRWRKSLNRRLQSGVSVDEVSVYVTDIEGHVLALARDDGSLLWEYRMSSEVNSPVGSDGEVVVVRGADGRIVALNAQDGVERWSKTYSPPPLTVRGYGQPLLVPGGVLLGLDDGTLIALAQENGRTLWQSEVASASGRSEIERLVDIDAEPVIDDRFIYVVSFQGNLAQLEPVRGRQLWSVPMSSIEGMAQSDDTLFLVDGSDHVVAVSKSSGDTLWTNTLLEGRHLTRPLLVGDRVVVADFEGYLHVLAESDGRLLGRTRAGNDPIEVTPILVGDTVVVYPTDAKLRSFRLGSS